MTETTAGLPESKPETARAVAVIGEPAPPP